MNWLQAILAWFRKHPLPTPTPPPAPTPVPPTPSPNPPSPPPPGDLTLARQFLDAHNTIRLKAGVLPLTLNVALVQSSATHASWMATHGTLTHGGDGTPQSRARDAGYTHGVGENAAMGEYTVDSAMALLAGDPPHFANIVSTQYVEMGAAMVNGWSCCAYGTSWVAMAPHDLLQETGVHHGMRSYSVRPMK
jgi:uncharacterized protein YkwD